MNIKGLLCLTDRNADFVPANEIVGDEVRLTPADRPSLAVSRARVLARAHASPAQVAHVHVWG
jgi:hypothetical protein